MRPVKATPVSQDFLNKKIRLENKIVNLKSQKEISDNKVNNAILSIEIANKKSIEIENNIKSLELKLDEFITDAEKFTDSQIEKFVILSSNLDKCLYVLSELNNRISDKEYKIKELDKEIEDKHNKIVEDEKKLSRKWKDLDIYKDRLNKRAMELGIDIKIIL